MHHIAAGDASIDIQDLRLDLFTIKGYIDIGLTDTMLDMLLETMGAVVVAIVYVASKGNFAVFKKKEEAGICEGHNSCKKP